MKSNPEKKKRGKKEVKIEKIKIDIHYLRNYKNSDSIDKFENKRFDFVFNETALEGWHVGHKGHCRHVNDVYAEFTTARIE